MEKKLARTPSHQEMWVYLLLAIRLEYFSNFENLIHECV